MEITQNINFKKILLLTIILVFINVPVESISSIFTNYDTLEDDLHKGYLSKYYLMMIVHCAIILSSFICYIHR